MIGMVYIVMSGYMLSNSGRVRGNWVAQGQGIKQQQNRGWTSEVELKSCLSSRSRNKPEVPKRSQLIAEKVRLEIGGRGNKRVIFNKFMNFRH